MSCCLERDFTGPRGNGTTSSENVIKLNFSQHHGLCTLKSQLTPKTGEAKIENNVKRGIRQLGYSA